MFSLSTAFNLIVSKIEIAVSKVKIAVSKVEIAVSEIKIAVSKLKLPWANWNSREQIENAVSKLK